MSIANIKRYAMRNINLKPMAQQTAVEWFIEQLPMRIINMYHKEIEQVKQMEKEQLVKAWDDGDYAYFYSKETGRDFDNGEEYYNETYKKQ
jgi:Zn-dependent oligopeptidase